MASTVYTVVKNALREYDDSRGGSQEPIAPAVPLSSRHEAMIDMYHPHLAVAHDKKWLVPRLAAQKPEKYKAVDLPVYLMLQDYQALRSAVKVRLTDHEHLPDRTEDQKTYVKVCRAKLEIQPAAESTRKLQPVTLIYSVNPPPRGSRSHSASPFYVAINFFEASEPPLPFSLSDSEKVALMAMGATRDIQARPKPQDPTLRVTRVGLRALRRHMEASEGQSEKAP